MKVGKYQIGRYHAIIKKTYEDGSIAYETSFTDQRDLAESVMALKSCVGMVLGKGGKNPKKLIQVNVIRGADAIREELTKAQEKEQ